MRRTFQLVHHKIKRERIVDSVKRDVKRYLKRERKKRLPEGFDLWGFECKFGHTAESSVEVEVSTLNKHIDEAVEQNVASFYIEILAKAGLRADAIAKAAAAKAAADVDVKAEVEEDEAP